MTDIERDALRAVTNYLESLLRDAVALGLPQDIAADIRMAIAEARKVLNTHGD